jgi:putrescine transport system permease protein
MTVSSGGYTPPADLPTFGRGLSFLDAPMGNRDADYVVAGVPMDWATSNRAGTREGPNAIRAVSRLLFDGGHPTIGADPKDLNLSDIGNFDVRIGDIAQSHQMIERQANGLNHLCTLGGDHSIALPLLRAASKKHGPLGLVQFDAHTDTWEENFGQELAHGTPFYHAIHEGLIERERIIQIGIRAPMEADLLQAARDTGMTILSAEDVHEMGPTKIAETIVDVVGDRPTYLTFDVDALDPAFAPGTGTPEMGGLHSWQVRAILQRLVSVHFIGMDVVEVSPPFDHAEITALAAATVVWDYLSAPGRQATGRCLVNRNMSWFNVTSLTLGFAFLYLPILILVIYSFNESRLVTVWGGFSTRWYGELFQNEGLIDAAWVTARVAFVSATVATVFGTMAAIVLVRLGRFKGRTLFNGMIYAPLVMPEVITGLSLLLLFVAMGFARGFWTVVIAHITFSMCYVAVVVQSRLITFDESLEEAAQDLGCPPGKSFFLITLPVILPAVLAGWMLAFTLSLDDLVIASFATGPGATTLPIKIYSQIRLGVTPEINAICTILIALVALGVITASLASKHRMMRSRQAAD